MDKSKRLIKFLITLDKDQAALSSILDVRQASVSRYLTGKMKPKYETLFKLHDLGLSLDWLATGTGSMFALNEEGKKLRDVDVAKSAVSTNVNIKPFDRFKIWIDNNYESLDKFALIMNIKYDYIYNVLYKDIIEPELFKIVENAGCSILWILNGEGSQYADNFMGKSLQIRNGLIVEDDSFFNEDVKNASNEEIVKVFKLNFSNKKQGNGT
ncbi:MAG: helix-turn-helix transcriptional regulator [Candidatus Kapabacteria bacterium]|nr:helix-turn-helix transcriptional regulator [Candidatus Kapabacteria bacterium]